MVCNVCKISRVLTLSYLSQSHLVGEDTIKAVFIQRNHPLDTGKLVVSQLGARNEFRLSKGVLSVILGIFLRIMLVLRVFVFDFDLSLT